MKEQSQGDRGIRKSNRQRVPNAFYTEGINQLKRAPRPPRDPPSKQPSRKRSIVYQDDPQSDLQQYEDGSEMGKEANDWLQCRMPKNGTMMRVQFVVQQPEEVVPERKREKEKQREREREEPPKPAKKSDTSFDLLSLFQKAIENVKDQPVAEKMESQPQQPTLPKQPRMKKEFSVAKQKRVEDIQGRITGVTLHTDRIVITHSKIGEAQIPLAVPGEMEEEDTPREDIEQYRRRLAGCGLLGQISILN